MDSMTFIWPSPFLLTWKVETVWITCRCPPSTHIPTDPLRKGKRVQGGFSAMGRGSRDPAWRHQSSLGQAPARLHHFQAHPWVCASMPMLTGHELCTKPCSCSWVLKTQRIRQVLPFREGRWMQVHTAAVPGADRLLLGAHQCTGDRASNTPKGRGGWGLSWWERAEQAF